MVNYREIIRLKSQDYSNTSIAASTGSSRNTVAEVWQLAQDKGLKWPIPNELTNPDMQDILYPGRSCTVYSDQRTPFARPFSSSFTEG